MINLILFVLSTIGMTNIIVHGKILDLIGLRPWVRSKLTPEIFELFECHECTGFWTGLLLGIIFISINPLYFIPCGFAGSYISQLAADLTNLITSKTEYVIEDNSEE